MREVGQRLKQIRLDKAISLQDIEEVTKVRVKYLTAIEEGNLDILPGQIYAMGFLRSYVRYLGLDEEEIMGFYKEYYKNLNQKANMADDDFIRRDSAKAGAAPNNAIPHMPIKTRQKSFGSRFLWLVLILIIAGSAVALYMIGTAENENKLPVPPPVADNPTDTPVVPDIPVTPAVPVTPDVNEEPVFDGIKVKVTVSGGNCWVGVKFDDNYTEETLKDGDTREYMAEETLSIRYGNAGVIQTEYNGEVVDPVGKNGEVKTIDYTK